MTTKMKNYLTFALPLAFFFVVVLVVLYFLFAPAFTTQPVNEGETVMPAMPAMEAEITEDFDETANETGMLDAPMNGAGDEFDAVCDFDHWIGAPVDEEALEETGRPYRILTPDSIVTMDYLPERINVMTDEDTGIVTGVTCG